METTKTHIRTAAVLYADDNQNVSTRSIHKKIIESAFLENGNKTIEIISLIEFCKSHFKMIFDEKEIISIVNDKKNEGDFVVHHQKEKKENKINLSKKRYDALQEKDRANNIEPYILQFISEFYKDWKKFDIKETIYKYLYELLNTNISAFSKLTKGEVKADDINIDSHEFSVEQRETINHFLNWDNVNKNKSLFSIVSFSIEFCLITNKKEGTDYYLKGIKDKLFYLDTNIIFRALGINGKNRQTQILIFLQKCVENGEKLFISKYTDVELKDAVDYHIKQIKKVPTGRINPKIFEEIGRSSGMYDFYHKWRVGKSNSGYELFKAYILDLYSRFINEFKVQVDYKIAFDENDAKILETINRYAQDIGSHKTLENATGNYDNTNFSDANNLYLIETKRGDNCRTITDTKYFFVSTDQSLRRWDFNRSLSIPTVLLPSQWMSVLLKYAGRTTDDYKSFVSFLNLKQSQPIINPERLHLILAGISEITEDFEYQATIIHRMVEIKFDGIIQGEDSNVIENAKQFTDKYLQEEVRNLKENNEEHKQKIISLETEIKTEIAELSNNIQLKGHKYDKAYNALVTEKVKSWKFKGKLCLAIAILLIVIGVYENLPTWDSNLPAKFMNWIDTLSDSKKNLWNGLNYAVIVGGTITCLVVFWKRHFSETHINEYKEKIKLD